jgi:hypothetical protein
MARSERSRKIESTILQALASRGQAHVAEFAGVSEAKVSRFKSEQLADTCDYLAGMGLKVVPVEMQCYKPESIAALMQLAKERMAELESPEQLAWQD